MEWAALANFFSPVATTISLMAVGIYALLIKLILSAPRDSQWEQQVSASLPSIRVLIAGLPLLGLFGTINGLMSTFQALSRDISADLDTLMAQGISDAMVTTQLGLAYAVPALLLQAFLKRRYKTSINSNGANGHAA